MPHAPDATRSARLKLALVGAAGALALALPAAQVLRYQGSQIDTLRVQRSALDLVGHTLQVQRGVLAHNASSARSLGGDLGAEGLRREQQSELDRRVDALQLVLGAGGVPRALAEAWALREDWLRLAQQIDAREIGVAQSELGHRLLLEQALTIGDLVTASADPAARALAGTEAPPLARWLAAAPALRASAVATDTRGTGAPDARMALAQQLQALLLQQADARIAALRVQRAGTLALAGALISLLLALPAWVGTRRAFRETPRESVPGRETAQGREARLLLRRLRQQRRADAARARSAHDEPA